MTLNQLVILVRLVANRRGEETGLNRQAATGRYRQPQEAQEAQGVTKATRFGERAATRAGDGPSARRNFWNHFVILVRPVANRGGEETGLNRQAATGTYRHPQEAPACRAAGRQGAQGHRIISFGFGRDPESSCDSCASCGQPRQWPHGL